jgi:hypothetical protein
MISWGCQDGILILQHNQEAISKKMILMNDADYYFSIYKSFDKRFVEFVDVYSARCYPLMETN